MLYDKVKRYLDNTFNFVTTFYLKTCGYISHTEKVTALAQKVVQSYSSTYVMRNVGMQWIEFYRK